MHIVRNYKDASGNIASIRRLAGLPGVELIITNRNNLIVKSGVYPAEENAKRAMRRVMTKPIQEV